MSYWIIINYGDKKVAIFHISISDIMSEESLNPFYYLIVRSTTFILLTSQSTICAKKKISFYDVSKDLYHHHPHYYYLYFSASCYRLYSTCISLMPSVWYSTGTSTTHYERYAFLLLLKQKVHFSL